MYSIGQYYDQDTNRTRWAVHTRVGVWYFPRRYGKAAAQALAARLNREAV